MQRVSVAVLTWLCAAAVVAGCPRGSGTTPVMPALEPADAAGPAVGSAEVGLADAAGAEDAGPPSSPSDATVAPSDAEPPADEAATAPCRDADSCKAGCDGGSADACEQLGFLLWVEAVRSDATWEDRATPFQRACELGSAHACDAVTSDFMASLTPHEQAPYLRDACRIGSSDDCAALAYNAVELSTADEVEAFLLPLCDGGSPAACRGLGVLHVDDFDEWAEAVAFWRRACDAGDAGACYELADHNDAYGPDEELIELGFRRACEGGRSCAKLAEHLEGEGRFDEALPAWRLDCSRGRAEGCERWFLGVASSDDPDADLERERAACVDGDDDACIAGAGLCVELDEAVTAVELLRLACDRDCADACRILGDRLRDDGACDAARAALLRACGLRDISACRVFSESFGCYDSGAGE